MGTLRIYGSPLTSFQEQSLTLNSLPKDFKAKISLVEYVLMPFPTI